MGTKLFEILSFKSCCCIQKIIMVWRSMGTRLYSQLGIADLQIQITTMAATLMTPFLQS